jgi:hypothetical protein
VRVSSPALRPRAAAPVTARSRARFVDEFLIEPWPKPGSADRHRRGIVAA